jgi:hypothetical protein
VSKEGRRERREEQGRGLGRREEEEEEGRDALMPHFRGSVLSPELAPAIEKKAESLVGE